ncbi:MAG: DNA-binding protein [Nocardioides sp.]
MAMNLRLTEAESEALRAKADQEGRSMQEVARTAIAQYVSERPQRLREAVERVRDEDHELLERLAQ